MQRRIEVINPCDQAWQSMRRLDGNKFCDKCKKEVIDFTGYSKNEIFEKIEKNGEVCGKLHPSHLENKIESNQLGNQYFSKFAFVIGLSSIIGLNQPVTANSTKPTFEQTDRTEWKSILPIKKVQDSITIKGKVTDADGQAIAGTNVIFKDSRIGTQTNLEGEFNLKIPAEKLGEKNFLIFSFVGFEMKEIRFFRNNKFFNVQLIEDNTPLGGITIVQKRNVFDKVGYFFHNLFSNHKTCN
ncbi:carboxypeptidase-like regulatory domain-containing protein [Christiangramia sp. LLG6405-1]|uniref:carboxypeptidase-like regulatory domain-containing protein n=1 Tax=Christiangramia sp. LLG6405-1 TaxID=3160832 RepID=UPI00386D88DF